MKCLYHCISTTNKCNIQIEFCYLNLNAQNQLSLLLYSKYMENHTMIESIDKHILFQEYLSPSFDAEEILMSYLDHN